MRHFLLVLLVVLGGYAQAADLAPYSMPRTEVLPIRDDANGRKYELYVKLPEGYTENPEKRYPVLYTTDAQWHMDMLSGATEYLMPDVILVGISWQLGLEDERPFVSRFRDYSVVPTRNPEHQAQYQFGQAGQHLTFVRDTVIPAIEARYRTAPEMRAYFGYSLGAVFGAYALCAEPDTFSHYILGSPAMSERSLNHLNTLTPQSEGPQPTKVFLSIGALETDAIPTTEAYLESLTGGARQNLSVAGLEIIEGSDHGTAFPETVIRGVKWLNSRLAD